MLGRDDAYGNTLVILAAGMGSRYGGLKQMEAFGPGGETIVEYTILDAFETGYSRVVCVIRRQMEDDFRRLVLDRLPRDYDVRIAFQEPDVLPEGVVPPAYRRTKPWGTAHALWCAREECLSGAFVAVNADDYYGYEALMALSRFLLEAPIVPGRYAMVGYKLGDTLSDSGAVSRGVCSVSSDGFLKNIVEHTKLERIRGGVRSYGEPHVPGEEKILRASRLVSMNCWGFTPDFWGRLEDELRLFFAEMSPSEVETKECYIPSVVSRALRDGAALCAVLSDGKRWYGVTYPEDANALRAYFKELQAERAARAAARKEADDQGEE